MDRLPDLLEKLFSHPIFWGVLALVAISIALGGKLSVSAAGWFMWGAWALAVFGVYRTTVAFSLDLPLRLLAIGACGCTLAIGALVANRWYGAKEPHGESTSEPTHPTSETARLLPQPSTEHSSPNVAPGKSSDLSKKIPLQPQANSMNPFDVAPAEWRLNYSPLDLMLHDLYLTDFESIQQKSSGAMFVDDAHTIQIQYTIATELELGGKFLIFYIPSSGHTAGICAYLAKQYNFVLDKAPQLLVEQKGVGDSGTTSTKEAIFTRRIFIYHETYLDAETTVALTKDFAENGASAIFRSSDYLSTKKLEARIKQHPR